MSARVRAVAAALLVAIVVAALVAWIDDEPEPEAPLAFGPPPASYRVEYRRSSADGQATTVEAVLVERPFRSRIDVEGTFVRRSAFGVLANEPRAGTTSVLAVPPALAAGDLRPDVALPAALDAGLVELGERRRIVGRECQVYRMGAPFSGGDIVPLEGSDQRAEACFDRDGLLLEERWWLGDELQDRLVAVDVDVEPRVAARDLAVSRGPTGSVDDGGGSVREVAVASRLPGRTFHELEDVPARFEHEGRYAVVWPSAGAASGVPGSGERMASLADVWTDGVDVIVFERGGSLHGSEVLPPPAWATSTRVGALGAGSLIVGLRGTEVRVRPRAGEFVRIVATLAPDDVLDLAAGIVETAGGPIVER